MHRIHTYIHLALVYSILRIQVRLDPCKRDREYNFFINETLENVVFVCNNIFNRNEFLTIKYHPWA